MQILYTHDIFSRQSAGGISRYFVELIRHLAVQPNDVCVLAGKHANQHLHELEGHPSLQGKYQPARGLIRSCQYFLNRYQQQMGCYQRNHAIAHHTYYSFSRPLRPARLVVTIHDMIPERFPHQFGWKAKFLSAAKRRTCQYADRILVNSHTTKQDLIDHFGIASNKVDVTYLGNSMQRFSGEIDQSNPRTPYILYVGSRNGYKNCQTLWQAFAQSQRLKQDFRVLCFGGGRFSKSELRLLDQLQLTQYVSQTGGDDRQLATAYRQASVFVYPSVYEGFGISPVEAMGFGCPVIVSTGGSIPEVVGPAGLYFDPQSPEMLTDALERVLYNDTIKAQLLPKMQARESQFRWEKTARQTLLSYQRAVA